MDNLSTVDKLPGPNEYFILHICVYIERNVPLYGILLTMEVRKVNVFVEIVFVIRQLGETMFERGKSICSLLGPREGI